MTTTSLRSVNGGFLLHYINDGDQQRLNIIEPRPDHIVGTLRNGEAQRLFELFEKNYTGKWDRLHFNDHFAVNYVLENGEPKPEQPHWIQDAPVQGKSILVHEALNKAPSPVLIQICGVRYDLHQMNGYGPIRQGLALGLDHQNEPVIFTKDFHGEMILQRMDQLGKEFFERSSPHYEAQVVTCFSHTLQFEDEAETNEEPVILSGPWVPAA